MKYIIESREGNIKTLKKNKKLYYKGKNKKRIRGAHLEDFSYIVPNSDNHINI